MKTMLSLFFLFLTCTAKPLVGAVKDVSEAVLDSSGEELKTGSSYYIVSAIWGAGGGGVALPAPTADNTCPIDVIQERSDLQRGLPVTFSPANTTESVIRESTDLNFKFSASPICEGSVSPVWKVDTCDLSTGQWFVTIGGVEGNPGPQTLSNWFKIERSAGLPAGFYKLAHCPSVCDSCVTLCSDVGRYVENGERRLALSHLQFPVVFVKADVESANKRIFSVI